jgi:PTH2 family peptidyl-tRNA hydrolase
MSDTKMVIVVRRDLGMNKGKIGAQCGHAAEYFMFERMTWKGRTASIEFSAVEAEWIQSSHAKVVLAAKDEAEFAAVVEAARRAGVNVHTVTDAGRTEFHGVPTLTCAAFGPDESYRLDSITGHLKLL